MEARLDSDVKLPTTTRGLAEIKQGFHDYSGFPGCIGAIDGTQIAIKAPVKDEEVFVCRKGYHSINTQIICDVNNIIMDVIVNWPGSVHDSTIYNQSSIKQV